MRLTTCICLALCLGASTPAFSATFVATNTSWTQVKVADSGPYIGRFTIGTNNGINLLEGHDLAPAFWEARSSYFRISWCGMVFGPGVLTGQQGAYDAPLNLLSPPTLDNAPGCCRSITTVWGLPPTGNAVTITQTLTTVYLGGQVREPMVRIAYDIAGDGGCDVVSLQLLLNTKINANDAAPAVVYNAVYQSLTNEACWDSPLTPPNWYTYESSPFQTASMKVGRGVLSGFGATPPDHMAIGDWSTLYNAPLGYPPYNYSCTGSSFSDTAVMLQWDLGNPAIFPPTKHIEIYYGPSASSMSYNNRIRGWMPAINVYRRGFVWPTPEDAIDVAALFMNEGPEACTGATATFMSGPGLHCDNPVIDLDSLEAQEYVTAAFSVWADDGPANEALPFSIQLNSDNCDPIWLDGEILLGDGDVLVDAEEEPTGFSLLEARPNPFNPATTISFSMNETGPATLDVFNLTGAKVTTLWSGLAERGVHEVRFDASSMPSGVYFYSLSTEQGTHTRKMVLNK